MNELHRREAIALLIAIVSVANASRPGAQASAGPGISYDAAAARASRVVIDSAQVANAQASTLTALLEARGASVSVWHRSGDHEVGGVVRLRGLATVVNATQDLPLLVVDGVRVDNEQRDSIGAALTVSGRDLFTWTRFRGLDPEAQADPVAPGAFWFPQPPLPRRFCVRLDVTP